MRMRLSRLQSGGPHPPHPRMRRHIYILRSRIILAIVILIVVLCDIFVFSNALNKFQSAWLVALPVIVSTFALIVAMFQWLFPVDPSIIGPPPPQIMKAERPQLPPRAVYCQAAVEELYRRLREPDVSAIYLTGIDGMGKSTLAKLIYKHIERQKYGSFNNGVIWFSIDADTKFSEIVETLIVKLRLSRHRFPDFANLPAQTQVDRFVELLKDSKIQWLIILDFKTPLDGQTRKVLADCPGFREWLVLLNNNDPSPCRVLFTSRPWSPESKGYFPDYVPNYIKEHHVKGLEVNEAVKLLEMYQVKATTEDANTVIGHCDGHAGALALLGVFLYNKHMSLATFLEDDKNLDLWMQEVTDTFVAPKYQLLDSPVQKLLIAFSIYRKPLSIEGALAVISDLDEANKMKLHQALPILINQPLLLRAVEQDHYRLPVIVADYVRRHIDHEAGYQTRLKEMHDKAAKFYQKIASDYASTGQAHHPKGKELWNEAAWHLRKAGKKEEAYNLLKEKDTLDD